jgi:hypothetical protein
VPYISALRLPYIRAFREQTSALERVEREIYEKYAVFGLGLFGRLLLVSAHPETPVLHDDATASNATAERFR